MKNRCAYIVYERTSKTIAQLKLEYICSSCEFPLNLGSNFPADVKHKEWQYSRFIGFLIIFYVVYPLLQALNNALVMYTKKYRQFVPNFTKRDFTKSSRLLIFHRQLIIKMLLHGANYLILTAKYQ